MFQQSRLALVVLALALMTLAGFSARTLAEDTPATKPSDLTGTWKWSVPGRDGNMRETTAKFTQEGDKLTGSVTGNNNNDIAISDGKVTGSEVTFKTVRKRQDTEITSTFKGKLEGDTIKGDITISFGDQEPRKIDWEAKRVKDTM